MCAAARGGISWKDLLYSNVYAYFVLNKAGKCPLYIFRGDEHAEGREGKGRREEYLQLHFFYSSLAYFHVNCFLSFLSDGMLTRTLMTSLQVT